MKQNRLLRVMYAGAILPLVAISGIFFYRLWNRTLRAVDVDSDIEVTVASIFSVLSYIIGGLLTMILSVVYYNRYKENRIRILPPLLMVIISVPVIILYGEVSGLLYQKAYLRFVNDKKGFITQRIWSANFEQVGLEYKGKEFVVSFYPVYTYDWTEGDSFGNYYSINDVFIDIKTSTNKIITIKLPSIDKGDCWEFSINELLETNKQPQKH